MVPILICVSDYLVGKSRELQRITVPYAKLLNVTEGNNMTTADAMED